MPVTISEKLRTLLSSARNVAVLTGAGISSESGVPTFRGDEGIWKKFKPEELANIDAFMQNPGLVWEWYAARKRVISGIRPNPGHYALAEMERLFPHFAIITQNIDNLHWRAGSRTVFELHGNIERNYCMGCREPFSNEDILRQEGVPRCPLCDGLIRPDVVWFGELLPEDAWRKSVKAAENAELFLTIGTSGVVYPAASIPTVAKAAGAYVVEVNIERTDISRIADETLLGKSGDILPQFLTYCPKPPPQG